MIFLRYPIDQWSYSRNWATCLIFRILEFNNNNKKTLEVTKRRSKLRHLWVSLCAQIRGDGFHSDTDGRQPAVNLVSIGIDCLVRQTPKQPLRVDTRTHRDSNWYYLFQDRMFHLTILFDHDCDVTCASLSRLNFTSQSLTQAWLDRILDYRHEETDMQAKNK